MSATPIEAPPAIGASFLRRGLFNQLVCLVIAAAFWLASAHDHGFFVSYTYSFFIGNLIWLTVDSGRQLTLRWMGRSAPGEREWPGWVPMLPLIAIGSLVGYSLGTSIADALLGLHSPSLFKDRGTVATTVIVAAAVTYFFYTREQLHAARVNAEQARRLALENQLKLLESQLEPHMLFNTLANLRVLIGIDAARAQAMLDRLIAFLRATLGASRATAHPLHAEFERLADYLALMGVRMGPRLQVAFDLPVELRGCPVPPLLLQPLVENAIRHGLEPKVDGGRIEVAASQDGTHLRLAVRDTGVGFDPARAGGFGTAHVRERLAVLYGEAAHFELAPDAGGGTLATIALPLGAAPAVVARAA